MAQDNLEAMAYGNVLLVEADDPDVELDVVAIHGLGGHMRETWTIDQDSTTCWLPSVFGGRVMLYGYDTNDIFSQHAARQSIIQEAIAFLESLHNLRSRIEFEKRPIVLVSHGLGGLFIKTAIVIAARDPFTYEWFTHAVRTLVFFDYPHRARDAAHLRQRIYHEIFFTDGNIVSPAGRVAAAEVLPDIITEINGMFIQSKILLQVRVVDLISSSSRASGASKYDINSSATLAIPFESIVEVKNPYNTMTRLSVAEVEKLRSKSYKWYPSMPSEAQRQSFRWLSASASPILPRSLTAIPNIVPDLDRFISTELNMFLHIQSSDGRGPELTNRVCGYLRNAGKKAVSFQFNTNDGRFSTVDTMLRTFTSLMCKEILWRKREESRIDMLQFLYATQACSTQHLLDYLKEIMSYFDLRKTVYVLGGLHECRGAGQQFISHLALDMRTRDHYPRFIITSTGEANQFLTETIPENVYASCMAESLAVKAETTVNLSGWLQIATRRKFHELASTINIIADNYQHDNDMLLLLHDWLNWDDRPRSAVERDISQLKGHHQEDIFAAIISSMPFERQAWAAAILSWVSLSLRPLRTEELVLVSSDIRSTTAQVESAAEIVGWFNGLLKIEHDEVHFGHPRIRSWLESAAPMTWWSPNSWTQGQAAILATCLRYLSGDFDLPSLTDWPAAHHFLYAVEFWPNHYKLIPAHDDLSQMARSAARRFFDDRVRLDRWLRVYKRIINPFINLDAESTQPLEIAAHFGFADLLEVYQENSTEKISLALIESARCGHLEPLCKFLGPQSSILSFDDARLPKLLRAAASPNNDSIIEEIMRHLPNEGLKSGTTPPWLSNLLVQAVMIDSESLVTKLLDLGADPQASLGDGLRAHGVIELAVYRNALGIIKMFIDRGFDISPVSGIGRPSIFRKLAFWGQPTTIKLLFQNGLKPQMVDSEGRGFLLYAMTNGAHHNLSTMLELAQPQDYCLPVGEAYHPLLAGAWHGSFKCVDAMIRRNADLSVADNRGNALCCAVNRGHTRLCERLLQVPNIDINYSSISARAPLFHAITAKKPQELVKLLLEHGANIETREHGDWSRTPLLYAAAMKRPESSKVVELLLQYHADIEAKDKDGWTPLYTACMYGSPEIARLLVDAGADLYATCGEGNFTPLHAAAQRPEVIPVLLAAGVDPSKSFEAEVSPLVMAAWEKMPLAASLMLKQTLEHKDNLPAALLAAVQHGNEEIVRQLLEMGTDVNLTDDNQTSLMCVAVARGDEQIVRSLFEFRPELDRKDTNGNTIGHWISGSTSAEIVRLLVNAGVVLDTLNDEGQTPLMVAVSSGNLAAVQFLLSVKAVSVTLNIANRYGTALHNICLSPSPNNIEILRLLVSSGADTNFDCGYPMGTALSTCCTRTGNDSKSDREQMIRFMVEECGANVHWSPPTATSPLHVASRTCDAPIIKLFIERGADPKAADDTGRQPLHLACYNSLAAVEALLDSVKPPAQHDFTTVDLLGRIPLHYAVASGQLDLIDYVLAKTIQAGLSIDTRDNDGWTPLLWAARNGTVYGWDEDERPTNAVQVIKLLLNNNANPKIYGWVPEHMAPTGKWSAADIAAYHKSPEIIGVLEREGIFPNRRFGRHKTGVKRKTSMCDACYLTIYGLYWNCQQCPDFNICYKCYQSLERVHPHHDLLEAGDEDETSQFGVDESDVPSAGPESGWAQAPEPSRDTGDGQDLIDYDMGVVSDDSSEATEDTPSEKDDEDTETS